MSGGRWRKRSRTLRFALTSATALIGLASLPAIATHVSTSTNGCPDPRTCGLYALDPWRWPVKGGKVTIEYYVNPMQPWMSEQDAIGSVLLSAQTWMDANPRIKLHYKGTTTKSPELVDGTNVIGWDPIQPDAPSVATVQAPDGRRVVEVDMTLNMIYPWTWSPCGRRHGSCTTLPPTGTIERWDVQAMVTHELGHWLSLRHVEKDAGRELTMYPRISARERRQSTLGFGDVRGVRAAYPCRCRAPTVYVP